MGTRLWSLGQVSSHPHQLPSAFQMIPIAQVIETTWKKTQIWPSDHIPCPGTHTLHMQPVTKPWATTESSLLNDSKCCWVVKVPISVQRLQSEIKQWKSSCELALVARGKIPEKGEAQRKRCTLMHTSTQEYHYLVLCWSIFHFISPPTFFGPQYPSKAFTMCNKWQFTIPQGSKPMSCQ